MPYVIGISGGSGSGKSTLAELLADRLGRESAVILHEDDYYFDMLWKDRATFEDVNFDDIHARDHAALSRDIGVLKAGHSVMIPQYDFVSHARKPESRAVESAAFIILEGTQIFYPEALRLLLDCKVYLDVPDDIRLIRRIKRDIAARGRSLDAILRQYLKTVRPMYLMYTHATMGFADIVVQQSDFEVDRAAEAEPIFAPDVAELAAHFRSVTR